MFFTLLREAIVNRTYGTDKNPHIYLFLLTIFGPLFLRPPVIIPSNICAQSGIAVLEGSVAQRGQSIGSQNPRQTPNKAPLLYGPPCLQIAIGSGCYVCSPVIIV